MRKTTLIIGRTFALAMLALIPAGARADAAGEALLQKCVGAEGRIQTLQADFVTTKKTNGQAETIRGTLKLKKPNLAQIVMNGTGGQNNITTLSDGKTLVTYMRSDNEYLTEAADMSGGNIARGTILEAMVFFNADTLNQFRSTGTAVKIAGSQNVGDMACRVLQITGSQKGYSYRIFVGPDNLLRGTSTTMSAGGQSASFESRLTNVKTDAALPQTAFAWTPPKGAKPFQAEVKANPTAGGDDADDLLAVGKAAPNFELPLYNGGKVNLASVYKANRATLLNFWSYF
jgi:outer membrane lipoprotein-sorting protein